LWRTPQATDAQRGSKSKRLYEKCLKTGQSAINLIDQVKHGKTPVEKQEISRQAKCWPTPTVFDATVGSIIGKGDKFVVTKTGRLKKINKNGVSGSVGLARMVKLWPTPQARDWKGSSGRSLKGKECDLPTATKEHQGQLNPEWVECLMGYPRNWTKME
jgi:hypothetical protein